MREFQPGETINGRYAVVRKLGAGAMGSVYLCEDRVEKNIKVALKVLATEQMDDQDIWAKGEYEALTRLRHPNLARVYNFGRVEAGRDCFIVSEFIKGLDLFSATEYLNYAEITDILVQICRSLEYIHSQGYVHFDVKPDNILVTRKKTIGLREGSKVEYDEAALRSTHGDLSKPLAKLIDFGLAEKITGSFSFAIKGTLNYLAPEMLNGQNPDKRADLYSLGVTLFQIVNRELPFTQDVLPFGDDFGVSGSRGGRRAAMLDSCMKKHPDYIREVVVRLTQEDPKDRFQSAKEVIQYLNRHSEHEFEIETEETRESYFHASKLVGRKKEMNALKRLHESVFYPERDVETTLVDRAAFEELEASRMAEGAVEPRLVIVSGEMGSGKSRLLEEFRHYLRLNNDDVFVGNCYERTRTAYQPIVEILRQVIYAVGLDSTLVERHRDLVVKLLPELRELVGGTPEESSERPEKEKHQFIEKLVQLLIEAAGVHPYVLVVNNLHWVDDATLDLLARLFERMGEGLEHLKLLGMVSLRPGEQSSERCRELLETLTQSGIATEIAVRRLGASLIREFLQALLGLSELPDEFVSQLAEQTGGNPLFLVETLKALEDEGLIKRQNGEWTIKTTRYSRVEIPQRMEDLLLKRLQRLDETKRQILETIAVLDKPVSPRLLQRFKCFSSITVAPQLRDLESVGMLRKRFDNNKLLFQIEQPKVREILYASLDEERRKQLHGAVAETLESIYGDREEALEEIAYHYQRSDLLAKALRCSLRAGERLKAIYANEQAFEHFEFALSASLELAGEFEARFEAREKLGEISTTIGRYEAADEHYRALLEDESRDLLAAERVTRVHLRRGKLSEIQGDYEKALWHYKEARNHIAGRGADATVFERARVYNAIGWIYVCMGKFEKAMTISLEALRVLRDESERMEHAMVYNTIGSANYFKGNYEEAIRYHRQSLELKEHLENVSEIVISLNNLGAAHLASADYGEAFELLQRALESSESVGDPYGRAMTLCNLAKLYVAVDELDKADSCLERCLEQAKSYNMRYLMLQSHIVRGDLFVARGDHAKAESSLYRVLSALTKQGNRAGLASVLLQIGMLHRKSRKLREAISSIEEAKRTAEELGITPLVIACLVEQARLEREAESPDLSRALEILRAAREKAETCDNPEVPADVCFEMAEVLVSCREVSNAKHFYRQAQERSKEVLETLPDELRESYRRKYERRFSPGGGKEIREEEREAQEAREPAGSTSERRVAASPEQALRRVNQLMLALPSAETLAAFLGQVVEHVLEVTQADLGCVLSLKGRNLSVMAVRRRGEAAKAPNPSKLLCLPLINRVLRAERPVLLESFEEEASAQATFQEAGYDCRSLLISPFLEPNGQKGALYLLNAVTTDEAHGSPFLLLQPFANLLPMAYLHFHSEHNLSADPA